MASGCETTKPDTTEPATREAARPGRNVMVVDDDDPVRVMLSLLLQTRGYVVRQATRAEEALHLLNGGGALTPDLVVSDSSWRARAESSCGGA